MRGRIYSLARHRPRRNVERRTSDALSAHFFDYLFKSTFPQGLITYILPLRSCNTMSTDVEEGMEYFNTVVVQPHRKLVTNQVIILIMLIIYIKHKIRCMNVA